MLFLTNVTQTLIFIGAFYLSVYPYFYSYLLVVQDQSVTSAGRITQTFTFAATVTAILVSFLIKYTKHYKYIVTCGTVIYMLGIGLMIKYRTQDASLTAIVGCQVALGIGGGMINVPTQLGVQASASHQDVGAATAVFLTLLEIGGAVGSAISGAIWSSNILPKLEKYLPEETKDQAKAIFGSVTLASGGWPMGSPTRDAINRAYQETMTKILIVGLCMCLPLIPLSLMMRNYRLDEVRQVFMVSHTRYIAADDSSQMDQHVTGTVIGGGRESADYGEQRPLAPSSQQRDESSDDEENGTEYPKSRSLLRRFRKTA